MIYSNHILAFPLLIFVWSLELFLLAATVRLILGWLVVTRNSRLCLALEEFMDPVIRYFSERLRNWRGCISPHWVPWAIVIGGGNSHQADTRSVHS